VVGDDELLSALGQALRPRAGPGPAPERVARLRARVAAYRAAPLPRRADPSPPLRPVGPPVVTILPKAPGGPEPGEGTTPVAEAPPALVTEVSRWLGPRWLPALRYATVAAVVGVLLGTVGGTVAARRGGNGLPVVSALEYDGPLEAADDRRVTGRARITRTGIGRTVRLEDDELPDLPAGEYYEAWLVGPNDTPDRPERISAGTFHPDDRGLVRVDLSAAVDPARYPDLAVTAEPGDGNPAASRTVVRRARLRPA
jgi:hypothetical protein